MCIKYCPQQTTPTSPKKHTKTNPDVTNEMILMFVKFDTIYSCVLVSTSDSREPTHTQFYTQKPPCLVFNSPHACPIIAHIPIFTFQDYNATQKLFIGSSSGVPLANRIRGACQGRGTLPRRENAVFVYHQVSPTKSAKAVTSGT